MEADGGGPCDEQADGGSGCDPVGGVIDVDYSVVYEVYDRSQYKANTHMLFFRTKALIVPQFGLI